MNGKERVNNILSNKQVDRSAFWVGNPHHSALKQYMAISKCNDFLEFSKLIDDDIIWIQGEFATYAGHNEQMWVKTNGIDKIQTSTDGIFANVNSIDEIKDYEWCDPELYDFTTLEPYFNFAKRENKAVMSGMWSPAWHILHDLFGMENCLVKFYEAPDVIHYCMRKITDFYLKANKKLFELWHNDIDIFFFGNDIGSQNDCIISPAMYREFIFPYMKELVDLARIYHLKVALHSCGAITRVIPDIINMGVDVLHPIQALAKNMDAENLQKNFGGKIIFMGGVDTQDILPFKNAESVYNECIRLRNIFGNRFILSPSHEALLPNVSFDNVLAMAKGAKHLNIGVEK